MASVDARPHTSSGYFSAISLCDESVVACQHNVSRRQSEYVDAQMMLPWGDLRVWRACTCSRAANAVAGGARKTRPQFSRLCLAPHNGAKWQPFCEFELVLGKFVLVIHHTKKHRSVPHRHHIRGRQPSSHTGPTRQCAVQSSRRDRPPDNLLPALAGNTLASGQTSASNQCWLGSFECRLGLVGDVVTWSSETVT